MIVVTGASGLVGANLVRALLANGEQVRAIVHADRRALDGLLLETAQANVCNPRSLQQAFAGAEVVYHLAGAITLDMHSWDMVKAINVTGTRNVVDACLAAGVRRLVHFSSIHAFRQEPLDQPLDESRAPALDPRLPPYDRSKAAAEDEVRRGIAQGLDVVILNPTAIIGPFDYKPSFFGQALIALARGRIPALVAGGFDWVDVRDVVDAALRAAAQAPAGAQYLLPGHWRSVRDLARVAAGLSGARVPALAVPTWLASLAALPVEAYARLTGTQPIYTRVTLRALNSNRQISRARAEADLGYRPRPFEATIADTLAWFAENKLLPPLHPRGRP